MNTATQETMMDYTPPREEEIARIKKLAAEKSAQMEALLADPVIAQFEANQKTMEKKLKDYLKLKEELEKISTKLHEVFPQKIYLPISRALYGEPLMSSMRDTRTKPMRAAFIAKPNTLKPLSKAADTKINYWR